MSPFIPQRHNSEFCSPAYLLYADLRVLFQGGSWAFEMWAIFASQQLPIISGAEIPPVTKLPAGRKLWSDLQQACYPV